MIKHKLYLLVIIIASYSIVLSTVSCSKDKNQDVIDSVDDTSSDDGSPTEDISLPTLSIEGAIEITINSAQISASIVNDGNGSIEAKGVCWNTTGDPTVSDFNTNEGSGLEDFTSEITGLAQGTEYFVRAFARNEAGTSYSEQISFTTNMLDPNTYYGDVYLDSQERVIEFGANNYQAITGLLQIVKNTASSSNIIDLTPLSSLTSVGGLKITDNPSLSALAGFEDLTSLGDFTLWNNPSLLDLDPLTNVTSITGLHISNNDALTDISGLANITSTTLNFLSINSNFSIQDISFLNMFQEVEDYFNISGVSEVSDLDFLSSLTYVGGNFSLASLDALTNINGLSNLTEIGGTLEVSYNELLTNLDGLQNVVFTKTYEDPFQLYIKSNNSLTNIDAIDGITSVYFLEVHNNPNLSSLMGLSSLASIDYAIYIWENNSITNLDPLSNLLFVEEEVVISYNLMLSDLCGIRPLYIDGGYDGIYHVKGNAYNPTPSDIIAGDCSL